MRTVAAPSNNNVYGGTTEANMAMARTTPRRTGRRLPAPEPDAYAYHPPTTVNYYGAGCYNCGGYSTAGAVAAGVVVGAGSGIGGRRSKTTTTTTTTYVVGNVYPTLPSGCAQPTVQGTDLLPLWQHVVQTELRRERRVLPGGSAP